MHIKQGSKVEYNTAFEATLQIRCPRHSIIEFSGVVQHQVVNNLPLGRNVDEMLRLVDALQFTEKHGEVCVDSGG